MNKIFMNRLTMLAVTLMASMACFAQGKFDKVATELVPHEAGEYFDLNELRYYCDKVASGFQELVVVGFASYVCSDTGDPTLMTSEWKGKVTIPNYVSGKGGCAAWVKSVAENAFTTTVCTGDDKPNRDQFADAAALVTKMDFLYDDKHDYLPADIEANAFVGLTNLANIQNFTPGDNIDNIDESAFSNISYNNAELKIPSGDDTMRAYADKTGWTKFIRITNGTKLLGDVNDDGDIDIFDLDDIIDYIFDDPSNVLGDLNGDGEIDIFDLDILIDKIVGY